MGRKLAVTKIKSESPAAEGSFNNLNIGGSPALTKRCSRPISAAFVCGECHKPQAAPMVG